MTLYLPLFLLRCRYLRCLSLLLMNTFFMYFGLFFIIYLYLFFTLGPRLQPAVKLFVLLSIMMFYGVQKTNDSVTLVNLRWTTLCETVRLNCPQPNVVLSSGHKNIIFAIELCVHYSPDVFCRTAESSSSGHCSLSLKGLISISIAIRWFNMWGCWSAVTQLQVLSFFGCL